MSITNTFNLGVSESYNAGPGSNWQYNFNIWKFAFDFNASKMYVWVRGSWNQSGFTVNNTNTNVTVTIGYSGGTISGPVSNTNLGYPDNNNTKIDININTALKIDYIDLYIYANISLTGGGAGGDRNRSTSIRLSVCNNLLSSISNSSSVNIQSPGGNNRLFLLDSANQFTGASNIKFIKATDRNIYLCSKYGQVIDKFTDGSVPFITQNQSVGLVSDGSKWYIISYYPAYFGLGKFGWGKSALISGQISTREPVVITEVKQGNDNGYNLPNPALCDSNMLIFIYRGKSNNYWNRVYLNSNGYLYDHPDGIWCTVGGYGGNGKGNASIVLISDGSKWYITMLQSSEYIDYGFIPLQSVNDIIYKPQKFPISHIVFTSTSNIRIDPRNIINVPQDGAQLFFIKRTDTNTNDDNPYITLSESSTDIIGSDSFKYAYLHTRSLETAYCMIAVKTGNNYIYYFLGYYPWFT